MKKVKKTAFSWTLVLIISSCGGTTLPPAGNNPLSSSAATVSQTPQPTPSATLTPTPSPTSPPATTPTATPNPTPTLFTLNWATPDDWGSLSISPTGFNPTGSSAQYPDGTQITATANAFTPTWKFGCFVVNGAVQDTSPGASTIISGSITLTIHANTTISAYFPYQTDTSGQCPETF